MRKLLALVLCFNLIISPVVIADSASNAKVKNQVITLVTSSVGANILMMCSLGGMQPSLYAFMAGSITHVLTEIAAGKSIKNLHEKNQEEIAALREQFKNGGETQRIIIEKNLSDEKEKLKFATRRANWLKAVKAVYAAAAALAAVEVWRSLPTPIGLNIPSTGACIPNHALPKTTALAITGAYTYQNARAGGALSSLMFLLLPIHTAAVPTMYQNGYLRTATFLASSLFTNSVVNDLEDIKRKLEGNVSQLELLLTSFDKDTLAQGGIQETSGAGAGGSESGRGDLDPTSGKNYALKELPKIPASQEPRECLSNDNGLTVSLEGCNKVYTLSKPKWDIDLNIPALKDFTNSAVDMTNALSEGNFDRADVLAGELSSQAARINKIKDDAIKKMNSSLKSSGDDFDLDAEVKRQYASMSADFDKVSGASGSNKLADSAAQGAKAGINTKSPHADKEIQGSSKVDEPVNGMTGAGLGFAEDLLEEENLQAGQRVSSLIEGQGGGKSQSDIAQDSNISIFKQVSNRYLLNYTKIFKRKDLPAPEKEDP